jgi:starch phosphorylase
MGTTVAAFKNGASPHIVSHPHAVETPEYYEASIRSRLHGMGKTERTANTGDMYAAVAQVVRDELIPTWEATKEAYRSPDVKQAYYVSIEWLLGPNISTALNAVGAGAEINNAIKKMGHNPDAVLNFEMDPGLGNGGLGRLAACFIDSGANLHLPLQGYGMMYDNGFFRQVLDHGRQVELPDTWEQNGNPWSFRRNDLSYNVSMFRDNPVTLKVVANDMMVPSYDKKTVNTLRLWKVDLPPGFDSGNAEVNELVRNANAELYPKDKDEKGKNWRIVQEYILTSASLQDILHRHLQKHPSLDNLAESSSIQINDTHPALVVPELIRLLTDVHGMEWEKAKQITRSVANYTNHTLMAEALESWHVGKLDYVLPRQREIIDRLQLDLMAEADAKLAHLPEDQRNAAKGRMSIRSGDYMRMGHLAAYNTSHVNGVSAMHTELVFDKLFPDLTAMRGEGVKVNHTNGISQRRFLVKANPELAELVTEALGTDEWITNLELLEDLNGYAGNSDFMTTLGEIKHVNKAWTARMVKFETGVDLDPNAMFDVQIKRIHGYKRQLMNVLHTVALYQDILDNPDADRPAVAKIMAGKAAKGYQEAMDVIELTDNLARTINADERTKGKIKLAFVPNYNVSKAEILIPGADLSEQISTAGTEASGTSNMKFALNGALTIGTRDGANVEIGEKTGEDNIFFFGMNVDEAQDRYVHGYDPAPFIAASPRLQRALDFVAQQGDVGRKIAEYVRTNDHYMIAADFDAYYDAHQRAQQLYHHSPDLWLQKSLTNIIAGGHFSSDRTIKNYQERNWGIREVVPLQEPQPRLEVPEATFHQSGLAGQHGPSANEYRAG